MDALKSALDAATSPSAACEAVVAYLAAEGELLPSIYLANHDRLRLVDAHGYWQVYDGMPAEAGVIGLTWRTGERHLLSDVDDHPAYLAASTTVHAELCVPLRANGVVVGALNVETTAPFTTEQVGSIDACAELLGARLEHLPLTGETPAQHLSRLVCGLVELAGHPEAGLLEHGVVNAAAELTSFGTAALVRTTEEGPAVVAGTGAMTPELLSLTREQLLPLLGWVANGSTVYTMGIDEGIGFPGHEPLRAAGAASIIVVPLLAGAGLVLLADPHARRPRSEVVALLELLAAQASTCLTVQGSISRLSERADRDALTQVGHHAAFQRALPIQRVTTPTRLAVLYLDVDHFKEVNDRHGHSAGDALLVALAKVIASVVRDDDQVFRIGGDEFAVLAHVADLDDALSLGERIVAAARTEAGISLSAGVAIAESEDADDDLVARADAALYTVKRTGRGAVSS